MMSIRALLIAIVVMGVQSSALTEPLKTCGEAHIALITPPEFKVRAKKIPAEILHQMADKFIKTKPSLAFKATSPN